MKKQISTKKSLLTSASPAPAMAPLNVQTHAEIPGQVTGEPYILAGRRIVFTNWFFVRPGDFRWVDEKGRFVSADARARIGDWGATMAHENEPHGIRLSVQPAQKLGPIIPRDEPWKDVGIYPITLLQDAERYKLWVRAAGRDGSQHFAYYESEDGLEWHAPKLGLVQVQGRADNNFLPEAPDSIFLDPSAPAHERYKGVGLGDLTRAEFEDFKRRRPDDWEPRADRPDAGFISCLMGWVSPDGLRWTRRKDPLAVEHADTQNIATYDPHTKKYVLYTRNWWIGNRAPGMPAGLGQAWFAVGRRAIGRSESDDFSRFPLSEVITVPWSEMKPNDLIYTNCFTRVPHAPDHLLMFPGIWNTSLDERRVFVMSSTDGKVWDRLPGEPVLATGAFGQFDGGDVNATPNLTELTNGDWVLPYSGYRHPHKYPRGKRQFDVAMAVWPKGRLVALEATDRGEFSTVGFLSPGRRLFINALTPRAGEILVEVCDLDGNPLPGRSFDDALPVQGDQFKKEVTWRNSRKLDVKPGEPIFLRFRMKHAKLFALDFK